MIDACGKAEKIDQMESFFRKSIRNFHSKSFHAEICEDKNGIFHHYTSLATLFDILESDSLWFSGLRFSNDSSEENLLGREWLSKVGYRGDNFIFCVGSVPDLLSQWRGYCREGGAAIGMVVARQRQYSVLHADYDSSRLHVELPGMALPVLYTLENLPGNDGALEIMRRIGEILENEKDTYSLLAKTDFIPYIKHRAFHEEVEQRILFTNAGGELADCIRFRRLANGTSLPYIVVKAGGIDESRVRKIPASEENIREILDNQEETKPVIVPQCSNQRELCAAIRSYLVEHPDALPGDITARVFCEGHLPIRKIQIAPMSNQSRIQEQVARFCQSKYWLRDVAVSVSEIPFITSLNS